MRQHQRVEPQSDSRQDEADRVAPKLDSQAAKRARLQEVEKKLEELRREVDSLRRDLDPAPHQEPDVYHFNQRTFRIPFQIDTNSRARVKEDRRSRRLAGWPWTYITAPLTS